MSQIGLGKKGGGSPLKKKFTGKQSTKLGKGNINRLQVRAIHPEWPVELYWYSVGNPSSGWRDGYTFPIRRHIDSDRIEDQIPTMDTIGIKGYFAHRISYDINEALLGNNGHGLFWLFRIVPGEAPSTEVTRREGLNHMRNFFMDSRYSKYPPSSMTTEDITDYATSLDHLVMDRDVINIINFIFDKDILNENFAKNFPDHACLVFGGPRYTQDAVMQFGYGKPNPNNSDGCAYAPGFVPPTDNGNMQKKPPPGIQDEEHELQFQNVENNDNPSREEIQENATSKKRSSLAESNTTEDSKNEKKRKSFDDKIDKKECDEESKDDQESSNSEKSSERRATRASTKDKNIAYV